MLRTLLRHQQRGLSLLAASVLALLLSWYVVPTSAGAHASLVASSPAAGQTAGGLLDHVDLVFDEGVTAAEVVVTGPAGQAVAAQLGQPAPNHLRITFEEPLKVEGNYSVAYSLLSADEDPLALVLDFRFEADADPALPVVAQIVESGGSGGRLVSLPVLAGLTVLGAVVALLAVRYVLVRRELERRSSVRST